MYKRSVQAVIVAVAVSCCESADFEASGSLYSVSQRLSATLSTNGNVLALRRTVCDVCKAEDTVFYDITSRNLQASPQTASLLSTERVLHVCQNPDIAITSSSTKDAHVNISVYGRMGGAEYLLWQRLSFIDTDGYHTAAAADCSALLVYCGSCGNNSSAGVSLFARTSKNNLLELEHVFSEECTSSGACTATPLRYSTASAFGCKDSACVLITRNTTALAFYDKLDGTDGKAGMTLRTLFTIPQSWRELGSDWQFVSYAVNWIAAEEQVMIAAAANDLERLQAVDTVLLWLGTLSGLLPVQWSWMSFAIPSPSPDLSADSVAWLAPDCLGRQTLLVVWRTFAQAYVNTTLTVLYQLSVNSTHWYVHSQQELRNTAIDWPDYGPRLYMQGVQQPAVSLGNAFMLITIGYAYSAANGSTIFASALDLWTRPACVSVPSPLGVLAISIGLTAALVLFAGAAVWWKRHNGKRLGLIEHWGSHALQKKLPATEATPLFRAS